MTSDENEILREHGQTLVRVETTLELLRKDLNGRIPKLEDRTDEHEKQLNYWRGALAVLAFFLLLFGGTEAWHIFSDHSPNSAHGRP